MGPLAWLATCTCWGLQGGEGVQEGYCSGSGLRRTVQKLTLACILFALGHRLLPPSSIPNPLSAQLASTRCQQVSKRWYVCQSFGTNWDSRGATQSFPTGGGLDLGAGKGFYLTASWWLRPIAMLRVVC